MDLPHFRHDEIACKCCGQARLADGFGEALEALRVAYAKPMVPSSFCRCAAHNKAVRGHHRSLHLMDDTGHPTGGTCALDVVIPPGPDRALLVRLAHEAGWSVGHASDFLHLDLRSRYIGYPENSFHYKR